MESLLSSAAAAPMTPTPLPPLASSPIRLPASATLPEVEFVNGGYGMKNPLLKSVAGTPPDVDPSPAPDSDGGGLSCRTCGKVS